jgi:cob(I)alamin adenosyltransferase
MLEKGYVQLYTGDGKGKTTAALGLALRAAGAGLKTIFIQFMKGQHYSELDSVKMLGGMLTMEQYGSPEFCRPDSENIREHYEMARRGIIRSKEVMDGSRDIVVLDEIVTALLFKLFPLREILEIIKMKPEKTELVLTGRGAPKELIEKCDLVTEMKEIRHYYQNGVQARAGIES